MECPYRFTLEETACVKEGCHAFIIIQNPKLEDGVLKHLPVGYCKLLSEKILE